MKKQITKTIFTCDECGTKTEELESFPYTAGWVYIHNINLQTTGGNSLRKEARDKHFCTKECSIKFIEKLIGETK